MPLEDALAELRAADPNEPISYKALAKKHSVMRSTLTCRHQGTTRLRDAVAVDQQNISPQQKEGLLKYIDELT